MSLKSTGWTPEKRARQAERMRKTKPWLKTTGPVTAEGKEAVKNNALKHGFRSREYKELCALLRVQAAFVKDIIASHAQTLPPPSSRRRS